jgi:hypothetical protein
MEQVFDLYVSTLAAPYVAGSHTAVVTSASGLPASGNFTLTILDAGTGAVLVVLEVTAVTGTTLTVTAEGPDASAAALSVVKGAILSSRSIQALIDQAIAANAPANFFQPLTPPVPGGFTNQNFNVGSGVTTTRTDNTAPVTSISLLQHDPNATKNIVAVDKAVIGAGSFHLTIALSIGPGAGTNAEVGLYLSDGGGGPAIIIFGLQNGTGAPATGVMLAAFAFSNFTTFGSVVFQSGVPAGFGPLLWLRIVEDATNRTYFTSSDGINFMQVFQEAVATHFVTARYGFGLGLQAASAVNCEQMATLYSFAESTP